MKSYIRYEDGFHAHTKDLSELSMNEIFRKISKMIAFSDCTDIEIINIVIDGKEYHYAGWRPGMEYTFLDKEGKQIWSECFPEWDH